MDYIKMLRARWIIFGIPAALVGLTVWSAKQAADSRHARRSEIVVASDEGIQPGLNPFAPVGEVDQQVAALVHEPLLKFGEGGKIEGALAEKPSWTQFSSLWFANEDYSKKAAEKIKKMTPEQWTQWHLVAAEAQENELRLSFSQVGGYAGLSIIQAVAEFGPLPVETLRVEVKEDARSHHEFFMQNAIERSQVKRVWFDSATTYELGVCGETVKFVQELELYYQNHPALEARIRTVSRAPMLNRPVLEMKLKDAVTFQDGEPVTGADVESTVRLVLSQPWPVEGREALRLIENFDLSTPRTVRVNFRELYGPSLTAFVGLPILPKKWIDQYAGSLAEGGTPFSTNPPSGAGIAVLESVRPRSLFLGMRDAENVEGAKRVQFLLDQPAASIRMGFAMKEVDVFWPKPSTVSKLEKDQSVALLPTAPQSRLMVLWNCRKGPLEDERLREALGLAVNRPALLQEMLQGQGEIHEGIFQPGLWFAEKQPVIAYDPTRAKQILYETGWMKNVDGKIVKGGQPLTLELLTVAGNPERLQLAQRLQKAWAELGIDTVITEVAWQEMLTQRLPARRFDAALIGLDFEKTWNQFPFWHSSQSQKGLNFSGISDPQLDSMLTSLRAEYDLDRVPELAAETEKYLLSLHPFMPLFSGENPLAIRQETLKGLRSGKSSQGFSLRFMLGDSQPSL